jgi:hypothetical protein
MGTYEENKRHLEIMKELQMEWAENKAFHIQQRERHGISSSQISAVIMYLLKKGIIK